MRESFFQQLEEEEKERKKEEDLKAVKNKSEVSERWKQVADPRNIFCIWTFIENFPQKFLSIIDYYWHDKITGCWLVERRTVISLIVQLYN